MKKKCLVNFCFVYASICLYKSHRHVFCSVDIFEDTASTKTAVHATVTFFIYNKIDWQGCSKKRLSVIMISIMHTTKFRRTQTFIWIIISDIYKDKYTVNIPPLKSRHGPSSYLHKHHWKLPKEKTQLTYNVYHLQSVMTKLINASATIWRVPFLY